jgi:hypothetical protein
MSEQQQRSSASLFALVALCKRIEAEAPYLRLLGLYEYPKPFVKVKDTRNGIVIGFSSETDYLTYVQIVGRTEGNRHA